MEAIYAWLFALMVSAIPPDRGAAAARFIPEARETTEERAARYREIAEAVADVAFDPNERPIFGGKSGRHATATLLLFTARWESAWRKDVDLGLGKHARGGGTDSCLAQIALGSDTATTAEGWTWRDLVADRRKCFRAALHIMHRSFRACRELPLEQRLAAYASGSCSLPIGQKKSVERVGEARRRLKQLPLPPAPDLGK